MLRSFDGLAVRQLGTRRLRAGLTAFGIVLGVGMVFAVLVLVGTIRHTFDDVIDSAWGKTDLVAMGESGGVMPQDALERVQSTDGIRNASGMIGATFIRLDDRGHAIRGMGGRMWVAGIDPAGPKPYDFQYVEGRAFRGGEDLVVERTWARDRSVDVGDRIAVATPTGRARLHVVGIFRFGDNLSFGGPGFAGMPLATARRLMAIPAGWSQISISASDRSQIEPLQARLKRGLGAGVQVRTPSEFSDQIADQMKALNVILYFFSGIALFVGGFLILNSFNMTVVQRLRELGTLRTLGATRRMIMRTVLLEALVIGAAGTALGLVAGLGLTLGLIELMRNFGLPVGAVQVSAGAAGVAIALGLLVTLVGAAWPARRAGRIPPIQAVLGTGQAARAVSPRRALAGLALFLPGVLLGGSFWFESDMSSTGTAVFGIALTMAMFAGMALAAPVIITPIARGLGAGLRRVAPTGGRLASDSIARNPVRTAATAVALTIGLSVLVVNSTIAAGFIGAVNNQIDHSYARDLTVQPIGQTLEQGGEQTVPPGLRERITSMPGVALVSPVSSTFVKAPGLPKGQLALGMGFDPATFGEVDTTPVAGATRPDALRGVAAGGLIVSASYAKQAGVDVGDAITLRGPGGTRRARVVATLKALTSSPAPLVQMSRTTMRAVYGITEPAELAVKLAPGADRLRIEAALQRIVDRDYPAIELASAADTKAQIRDHINQQFNLFNAIIVIAVVVSLLGVVNTLAIAVAERTREIGVLRALGASRWLVRRTMTDESLLITITGALAGIALGTVIAAAWIAGLGDVLPGVTFHFPWTAAAYVAIASVVLGVIASVLPARRAARLDVIDALSYE